MEASGSQYIQLAVAMLAAMLLFIGAFTLREKTVIAILVLLLPFQLITSRFGSMNVMIIYLVSAAFLMRGHFRYRPLFLAFVFVTLAYLISMTQAPRPTWFDHGTYLIGFGSNVLAFYILYNYTRREENWLSIWRILLTLNIMVLVYSAIQLTVGFGRLAPFGIAEFSVIMNREDQRLVGPFQATAVTAEYLVIMVLFLAYAFLKISRPSSRLIYASLIAGNCFFLVTTGNRGGLISLIVGFFAFLIMFRREIGLARSIGVVTMVTSIFIVMAAIAVQFTEFNRLFVRLEQTEVEGFIPDSRQQAWPTAWEGIMEKPFLGHGPRLRLIDEENRRIRGHTMIGYPHSAYLHLLYTIGVIGLAAWAALIVAIGLRLLRAARNFSDDPFAHGLPRLGLLILFVVLVSQVRIEMFRFNLFDYQNVVFAIFGILIGFADELYQKNGRRTARVPAPDGPRQRVGYGRPAIPLRPGGQLARDER